MSDLLLDTCAVIWTGSGADIGPAATDAIDETQITGGQVHVSVFSAWELGMLVARGRLRLSRPPLEWFHAFAERGRAQIVDLTTRLLVASSFLPGSPPGDPADRILIATARERGFTIVTRDRAILRYGAEGHVQVLPC